MQRAEACAPRACVPGLVHTFLLAVSSTHPISNSHDPRASVRGCAQDDPRWALVDPVCTFLFAVLVLLTTRAILRDISDVLMERVPRAHDSAAVEGALLQVPPGLPGTWLREASSGLVVGKRSCSSLVTAQMPAACEEQ